MEHDRAKRPAPETHYVHPDPVTDAALDWFVRLQASPEDAAVSDDFARWRNQSPNHAEAFAKLTQIWTSPEIELATQRLAQRSVHPLPIRRRSPPRRRWTRSITAIAAAALIAIGLQWVPALIIQRQADYMTATGDRQQVILPDGSRMTLNTASAVALRFSNGERSVRLLQGEAFFDVVPDATHPFTVAGRFAEVGVKGTAFSVRTDDQQDVVVLARGSVEVARLPDRAETARLEPGYSVSASATALSGASHIDIASSLAWLDGRIVFNDRPLRQVLDEVKRYYPRPVLIADRRIGDVTVSGSYRLANPEGTIRSLAMAAGATVTRIPGGLLILR
ncbi:FecR family protein [Rhodopseudomonas palustris]|uniref:Putative FecR n=1 Tax=Rhodopseudomonas palustris (strain BisB18) TaxID=316056 RepID=Q217A2_RHOPB